MSVAANPTPSAALIVASILIAAALHGCSTPAVGAPCLPEQIPDTGFDPREAYIESSSVQCETRVCMVYQLAGDPTCAPVESTMDHKCAASTDVEDSVYCTCRCDSGNTGFAECECPDGFSCIEVLSKGGPGVRGGYCVKNSTVTR